MSYNFEFAVSAQISTKVAIEMITKVVEEQTGKKVASVEPKVRYVSKGYGPGEFTETVFDGFTVNFQNEKTGPASTASNREFKPDRYQSV